MVAPHAGAWIETLHESLKNKTYKSHPMRVRGLKHDRNHNLYESTYVAPHAGAWIET